MPFDKDDLMMDAFLIRCNQLRGNSKVWLVTGVGHVLHPVALGPVRRPLADPINTHSANINGFSNVLVAATAEESCKNEVYNVAIGNCTSSIQLCVCDVRHSRADTSRISRCLGYKPSHNIFTGLAVAVLWYMARHSQRLAVAL
jgi:nucleoside-diphosphate-sugar epimerase